MGGGRLREVVAKGGSTVFSLIFYDFSKFLISVLHGRVIAKNGASWSVMSSKD